MIKAYRNYKEWWISEFNCMDIPAHYYGITSEQAFESHINELKLYGLMEMLVNWSDDEN